MNTDKLEAFILALIQYEKGMPASGTQFELSKRLRDAREALRNLDTFDTKDYSMLLVDRMQAIESLSQANKKLKERTDERDTAFGKLDELRECNRRLENTNRELTIKVQELQQRINTYEQVDIASCALYKDLETRCESFVAQNLTLRTELEQTKADNKTLVGIYRSLRTQLHKAYSKVVNPSDL